MRGLKKRKSAEYTQRQATPISLDMLRVRHSHLVIAPGFTEASRLRFFAVPALAFYGMCLINEVFSLKRKNPTLGLTRPSTSDAEVSSTYGAYKLEGRKAEVAEGRCNNMHHLDDSESSTDVLSQLTTWLTLSKISKSVIKTDDSSPGCENARVEWGKKMLNRHSLHCSNVLFEISIEMGCPRVGTFDNNGATSGSPLTRSAALVPSTGLCLRRLNDDSHCAWRSGGLGGLKTSRLRPFCVICWTKQLRMKTRNWWTA
ncbi:hypothetical protein Pcac1_g10501 [Phytophthora cactorum]|uniref:Uncharacterized protein n=1 Tax=Phytophthora cactorum TaxID=29920 RepID=A0A329T434_9STRA|nr:hypothetical protein Pcac1_g10501 [Phytophthora cactorum]KAG2913793.1 hypothetical protein PC115_g11878 [Phytophthora cactorum]KAG3015181.1 hypothetical protein PC120_g12297 [Phytophthora cactorum]KAG3055981.1 hypothetical protein PC122_g21548 [Phytophthora cactorum]RAW43399.1 hypothetical protein PC110_g363 [Phytophthora cactorum]